MVEVPFWLLCAFVDSPVEKRWRGMTGMRSSFEPSKVETEEAKPAGRCSTQIGGFDAKERALPSSIVIHQWTPAEFPP